MDYLSTAIFYNSRKTLPPRIREDNRKSTTATVNKNNNYKPYIIFAHLFKQTFKIAFNSQNLGERKSLVIVILPTI